MDKKVIIGHEQTLNLISGLVAAGRLAHTNLFSGPEGIGKMLAAKLVVQKMICLKGNACGECGKCRRVMEQQSEDAFFIVPDGDAIKIEQIREAINFLSLKALGPCKFVIIDKAELLTLQASNALLKSLEEPPKDSYFILISSQASRLLPTIRSRCQSFRFHPLSLADVRTVLRLTDGDTSNYDEWMLRACEGRSGRVLRWIERGGERLRDKAFAFVKILLDPSWPSSFFSVSEMADSREEAEDLLNLVLQILRDSYLFCFDIKSHVVHVDRENRLKEFSLVGPRVLLTVWQKALQLEQELTLPLDLKLSLENLYLESRNTHAMD